MPGGGSLGDSLEPAGNSTLGDSLETKPGEKGAGPAVKNFIEKLQTASMGLDTVKDWGEDDLNEFAQMFLIDRDQTIEVCKSPIFNTITIDLMKIREPNFHAWVLFLPRYLYSTRFAREVKALGKNAPTREN